MVKIKRKVQKNLPQLIEYIFANNLKHKWKDSDNTGGYIHVYDDGKISVDKCTVDSTFTVEVEEVVDEDTELDLIERFVGAMGYSCYTTHRMTIKDCLRRSPEECTTTHFYIENDNRELVLIWREGKLVD